MKTILYADDEIKYRRLIKMFLENYGYRVLTAENGLEMLDLYDKHKEASLIILDVMMPEMDGHEVCRIIREASNVPILMLTALSEIHDEVSGLKLGADDYIAKPFSNEKLIARIEALFRRTKALEREIIREAGFTLSDINLTVSKNDMVEQLTLKEYLLLKTLLMNKDQILLRDQLLDKVWGLSYEGDPRTLDTHIKSLRNKLGKYGTHIKTRRGQGYYFRSMDDES